jgi:hypothetical protein
MPLIQDHERYLSHIKSNINNKCFDVIDTSESQVGLWCLMPLSTQMTDSPDVSILQTMINTSLVLARLVL